jgi:hypothetical protein
MMLRVWFRHAPCSQPDFMNIHFKKYSIFGALILTLSSSAMADLDPCARHIFPDQSGKSEELVTYLVRVGADPGSIRHVARCELTSKTGKFDSSEACVVSARDRETGRSILVLNGDRGREALFALDYGNTEIDLDGDISAKETRYGPPYPFGRRDKTVSSLQLDSDSGRLKYLKREWVGAFVRTPKTLSSVVMKCSAISTQE